MTKRYEVTLSIRDRREWPQYAQEVEVFVDAKSKSDARAKALKGLKVRCVRAIEI